MREPILIMRGDDRIRDAAAIMVAAAGVEHSPQAREDAKDELLQWLADATDKMLAALPVLATGGVFKLDAERYK